MPLVYNTAYVVSNKELTTMVQPLRILMILGATCLVARCQTTDPKTATPRFPSHPDFKPTPEVPAMPKALMKMPRTNITRAKFPVVDFHLHGQSLKTSADY